MEKQCFKDYFPIAFDQQLTIFSHRRCRKNGKQPILSCFCFSRGCKRRDLFVFRCKSSTRQQQISSCDNKPSISTQDQPTANPLCVGPIQLMQLTASKLAGESVVQTPRGCRRRPTLYSQIYLFLPSDRDRSFLAGVSYTPAAKYFIVRLASTRHILPAIV